MERTVAFARVSRCLRALLRLSPRMCPACAAILREHRRTPNLAPRLSAGIRQAY